MHFKFVQMHSKFASFHTCGRVSCKSTEELKAMISAVNTELELCNRFDAVVIAGTVPVGVTGAISEQLREEMIACLFLNGKSIR